MPYTVDDLPPLLVERITAAANRTKHGDRQVSQADLAASKSTGSPDGDFFDAISLDEALQLYAAVRDIRPTDSAEIGFCCGGSGMAILKALADNGHGRHHACDPYQTKYAGCAGRRNAEKAGLADRLTLHEAFPETVFPGLPPVQFAFIDASHLFDLSMLDFVLVDKRLEVGGVVAFHDLWMGSLQALTRYILRNRHYKLYTGQQAGPAPGAGSRWKRAVAAVLQRAPAADRVFRQEVLRPWSAFGIGNMVLLQKTAEDDRDWRHFVRF